LPALQDSISLTLATPEEVSGRFLGFDQWFDSATVVSCIQLRPKGQQSSRCIDLRQVTGFRDASQNVIRTDSLTVLLQSKRLPLRSGLLLSTFSGLTFVPFEQIDRLMFRGEYGAVQGFVVGLFLDAAVVGIAALIIGSVVPDCIFCGADFDSSSCPYVYSFDGERYVRDAELFAGAIFPAAQRTDWSRLDHLAADHGQYRLKITNEREETEYVDELSLLAVDHPLGTEVVPTFEGSLCLLHRAQPPTVATSFAGSDVLDLVAAIDDQIWIGNPFGRNPDDSSQLRDGLNLQFPRPHDADSVTLALNVRNTSWGAYLQNQFVQLLGKDAQAWYDTLDNSLAARQALHRTMLREGMLQVLLWNGLHGNPPSMYGRLARRSPRKWR